MSHTTLTAGHNYATKEYLHNAIDRLLDAQVLFSVDPLGHSWNLNVKPEHLLFLELPRYYPGDRVFIKPAQRLATVLDVYGDGVRGADGEIRLDVSGNTVLTDIEPYDRDRHSAFDHTFVPIKREWVAEYGITQPVPTRD